jgi:hypothetical protein
VNRRRTNDIARMPADMTDPGAHSPKSLQPLRQTLQRLHAELQAAQHVDAASRRLLREVLADIERVLGEPASPGRQGGAHTPRLEQLAVALEAEHPGIAGTLRQLIDLLDRGGF